VALGERVKAGLKIVASHFDATAELARAVGIPLSTLDEHPEIDITSTAPTKSTHNCG